VHVLFFSWVLPTLHARHTRRAFGGALSGGECACWAQHTVVDGSGALQGGVCAGGTVVALAGAGEARFVAILARAARGTAAGSTGEGVRAHGTDGACRGGWQAVVPGTALRGAGSAKRDGVGTVLRCARACDACRAVRVPLLGGGSGGRRACRNRGAGGGGDSAFRTGRACGAAGSAVRTGRAFLAGAAAATPRVGIELAFGALLAARGRSELDR
jgi:hypothetical protein